MTYHTKFFCAASGTQNVQYSLNSPNGDYMRTYLTNGINCQKSPTDSDFAYYSSSSCQDDPSSCSKVSSVISTDNMVCLFLRCTNSVSSCTFAGTVSFTGGQELPTCTATQFQCADRTKCVDNLDRCDGYKDCADGSDESGCYATVSTPSPWTKGQTGVVQWSTNISPRAKVVVELWANYAVFDTLTIIGNGVSNAQRSLSWGVDASLTSMSYYVIVKWSTDYGLNKEATSKDFTISGASASIAITKPEPNQQIQTQTRVLVAWTSSGLQATDNVVVEMRWFNVGYDSLQYTLYNGPNQGSFEWIPSASIYTTSAFTPPLDPAACLLIANILRSSAKPRTIC